jgi:hypothetical protein
MKKTFYKYTNKFLVSMQMNTKKQIKNFAQFKKIVALSNLIQRIYHNDIRNMLP